MSRRIVRIRKSDQKRQFLEEFLKIPHEIKKINSNCYSSKYRDFYVREDHNKDPIYLVMQFFIHKNNSRQEEIKYCLKRNIDKFDKIYLLNEKIYSKEELGLDEEEMENIQQINIEKRLKYKGAFDFMKKNNKKGYYVLCNSDIFFDETIKLVRKTTLSKSKSLRALLRYDYKNEKNLNDCKIFGPNPFSQDTWIIHSDFLPENTENLNFPLGKAGCDNSLVYRFFKMGYKIYNDPYKLKTYHYHQTNIRNYKREDTVESPWLWLEPT